MVKGSRTWLLWHYIALLFKNISEKEKYSKGFIISMQYALLPKTAQKGTQ